MAVAFSYHNNLIDIFIYMPASLNNVTLLLSKYVWLNIRICVGDVYYSNIVSFNVKSTLAN